VSNWKKLLKKQQAKSGLAHEFICKFILTHLHDLQYWKDFLERDRNYKSEVDASIPSLEEFQKLSKEQQIPILVKALNNENARIEKILEERAQEKEKDKEQEKKKEREKLQESNTPSDKPSKKKEKLDDGSSTRMSAHKKAPKRLKPI